MLNNNTVLKIVSLILAICLWGFVMGEVNPTITKTIRNVPIEFTNVETIENQGITLLDQDEYYADVEVRGSRSDLNTLEADDILVTADLNNYQEGEQQVAVDVVVPEGISFESVREEEITVTLEELVSVEKTLEVEFAGEYPENQEPGNVEALPDTIEVQGAKSLVAQIESVCVQVDVAKLDEKIKTFRCTPVAMDSDGEIVKNVNLSANSIEVQAMLYDIKEVPLEVEVTGSPDEEYGEPTLTVPKTVAIKGTAEILENVDSVSAADVDISNVAKSGTIAIQLQLPYGVEVAASSKAVGIEIEFKN